jgi:hypothetical protein
MKGFKDRLFYNLACIMGILGAPVALILGLLDYFNIWKNDLFALLFLIAFLSIPMLLLFSVIFREK